MTNNETLKLSITKFWGENLNQIGNVVLAGHNSIYGEMFGKVKQLEVGDIVEITDKQKLKVKYEIIEIYVIDPNDLSIILPKEEGIRELTLLTCTNGNKNRLVVKAKEKYL